MRQSNSGEDLFAQVIAIGWKRIGQLAQRRIHQDVFQDGILQSLQLAQSHDDQDLKRVVIESGTVDIVVRGASWRQVRAAYLWPELA